MRTFSKIQKKNRARSSQTWQQKRREKILTLLGNKCVKCGFLDKRVLQVDHIKGVGRKELKTFKNTYQFYKHVLKVGKLKYQLLCSNCNWVKKFENQEHPNIS